MVIKNKWEYLMNNKLFVFLVFFFYSLYIVGELIQKNFYFPSFIRWHMSDLGSVSFSAMLYIMFCFLFDKIPKKTIITYLLSLECFLACIEEVLRFFYINNCQNFDVIDCSCFIFSYLILMYFLHRKK